MLNKISVVEIKSLFKKSKLDGFTSFTTAPAPTHAENSRQSLQQALSSPSLKHFWTLHLSIIELIHKVYELWYMVG